MNEGLIQAGDHEVKGVLRKKKMQAQDVVGFLQQTRKIGKSDDNGKEQLMVHEPQLGKQKLNLDYLTNA